MAPWHAVIEAPLLSKLPSSLMGHKDLTYECLTHVKHKNRVFHQASCRVYFVINEVATACREKFSFHCFYTLSKSLSCWRALIYNQFSPFNDNVSQFTRRQVIF